MRSPREQADEFLHRASDYEKQAMLEQNQTSKSILDDLAADYRRLASELADHPYYRASNRSHRLTRSQSRDGL